MRYSPLPKLLVVILSFVVLPFVLGQPKSAGEVDVAKCWSCAIASGERFVSDGVRIYVAGTGGRVDALLNDGQKVWSAEFGGEISSNLLSLETGLVMVTSPVQPDGTANGAGVIRVLSKETGITVWTAKMPDAGHHFLGTAGGVLLVVSGNGVVQSLDAKTGAVKWRREIADGFAVEPLFHGDRVYVVSTAKQLFTIGLAAGEIESMTKLDHSVTSRAVTQNGGIVIGDERGSVISLTQGQQTNWKFKTGGSVSAIVPVGNDLLVASNDNFVYFLTGQKGGLAWKRRLPTRPLQVGTIGAEHAIVYGVEERAATLIALSSGKVTGQITLGIDETLVARPVTTNDKILFLTTEAVRSYSLNGCPQKQVAAAGNNRTTAIPK